MNNIIQDLGSILDNDNQLTKHMLNYIRDGMIVVNNNFNIVYINQYAINIIDMIHHQNNNYLNISILTLFPQLEVLNDSINTKLFRNRHISAKIEKIIMCPIIIDFIVNSIISNNNIYHIILLCNDDTHIEHKNQINLIAYLSHELRNPLQSLSLANYLLQSTLKVHDDKLSSYTSIIARSCSEMKKIINDILDLSKIEANEFIIEFDVCNIRQLIENIISVFSPSIQDKNLSLSFEINKDVPQTIYTDEVRLSQILSNLISNAIKFSKSDIKLLVQWDNGIKFSVIDNGEGIKKEELPNIFKKYCRTSLSDKINSNGLGLYVSQQIANLLGGYISVVSEHKKGSTFTLFHPIKLESSSGFIYKLKYDKIISAKILIVDDDEANLTLFKLMLDHFNYIYSYNLETNTVMNGLDAINICKMNNYDIIFMDINMADIDGCTASKIIKLNKFTGKIIATTGNILAEKGNCSCINKEKYNYFDDIIIKPYDDSIILKTLHRYL